MFTKLSLRLGRTGALLSILLIPVFWIILSPVAANAAGDSYIDDLKILTNDNTRFGFTIEGKGDLEALKPMFYADPPRLVYDFNQATLRYNKGQTKKFPVGLEGLKEVAIAQFQLNPNIVRIVFSFDHGTEKTLLKAVSVSPKAGKLVFTYPGSKAIEIPESVESKNPAPEMNVVTKLYHKRLSPESDRLILDAAKRISGPIVKNTPGWMSFTFRGLQFDLPSGSDLEEEFNVPVKGSIVEEIRMANFTDAAVMKLKLKDMGKGFDVDYKLNYGEGTELEILLSKVASDAESKTDETKTEQTTKTPTLSPDNGALNNNSASTDLMKAPPKTSTPSTESSLDDHSQKPEYVEVKRSLEPGKLPNTKTENAPKTASNAGEPTNLKVTLVDDDNGRKKSNSTESLKVEEVLNSSMEKAVEGGMPVAMLMIFNKEKGSYTLYMLYYQDGNFRVRHYP